MWKGIEGYLLQGGSKYRLRFGDDQRCDDTPSKLAHPNLIICKLPRRLLKSTTRDRIGCQVLENI